MNAHEEQVRAAVAKTQEENKVKAARFRVEQAARAVQKHKSGLGPLQAALEEAEADLKALLGEEEGKEE